MKTLKINLDRFPFFHRETDNHGVEIRNRCGRDFLYYALAYYLPNEYSVEKITAHDLEHKGLFGISVPAIFAWTQIQFMKMPRYLKEKGLKLFINQKEIYSFWSFVKTILFSRIDFNSAISLIERSVDNNIATGIDISIGFMGLLDHVMFVYGYDKDNLYIFETTNTPINYSIVSDKYPLVKRLSKEEIKRRWTRFGRVWRVE